jgi:pentatricopeptide repeat protein
LQALISALGGQWEKALEVFAEMKEKAKHDPECEPNTITYSVRPGLCMMSITVHLPSCLYLCCAKSFARLSLRDTNNYWNLASGGDLSV